jgi:hypothetical protein
MSSLCKGIIVENIEQVGSENEIFPCSNNNVPASGYHTEDDKLIIYDKLGERTPFWSFALHDDCHIHVVQLKL